MQPHRSRYWLNAHPTDPTKFQQMNQVCQLYLQASALAAQGVHVGPRG